ncbi:MAG: hypothetical protein JWN34_1472 [Bryobacterales bacterium]|nr:hypothetical protein [Bryobacterales bacterium]
MLDASVAAKWVLPAKDEPLVDEAIALLERYAAGLVTLVVPDLFWPEIANLIWKAARNERISVPFASEQLNWLQELRLRTAPSAPLVNSAMQIAVVERRAVYDSLYVALAVSRGLSFVTADERLVNALGTKFPVRWLGSLQTLE